MPLNAFKIAVFLLICTISTAQNIENNYSISELENGEVKCNDMEFKNITDEEQFIYCRMVYSFNYKYRKALKTMVLGQRKFPYSYNIRLNKALALQENGNSLGATKEMIGLIKVYPQKAELHNYLGRIQYKQDRIKSIMPLLISIQLKPNANFAEENLTFVNRLFSMSAQDLRSEHKHMITPGGSDDFEWVNYRLSESLKDGDIHERKIMVKQIQYLANALKKSPHSKKGFFWKFYAEYFIELNNKKLIIDFVNKMFNIKSFQKSPKLDRLNKDFSLR